MTRDTHADDDDDRDDRGRRSNRRPEPKADGSKTILIVIVSVIAVCVLAGCGVGGLMLLGMGAAVKNEATAKVYTREEFERLVIGKTKDEVIKAVGRPDRTSKQAEGTEYWYYSDVIRDPITGKLDRQVQVVFEDGLPVRINFS
jgi:outer membrane protein assembly factor BamE (lipoprotein component of BamABCDE complex)